MWGGERDFDEGQGVHYTRYTFNMNMYHYRLWRVVIVRVGTRGLGYTRAGVNAPHGRPVRVGSGAHERELVRVDIFDLDVFI